MKTAEEILSDHSFQTENGVGRYESDIIEAMKAYAQQCAAQALKDAAERASVKKTDSPPVNQKYMICKANHYSVDKESITSTPIKTP